MATGPLLIEESRGQKFFLLTRWRGVSHNERVMVILADRAELRAYARLIGARKDVGRMASAIMQSIVTGNGIDPSKVHKKANDAVSASAPALPSGGYGRGEVMLPERGRGSGKKSRSPMRARLKAQRG